jgi:hypothetical protein
MCMKVIIYVGLRVGVVYVGGIQNTMESVRGSSFYIHCLHVCLASLFLACDL